MLRTMVKTGQNWSLLTTTNQTAHAPSLNSTTARPTSISHSNLLGTLETSFNFIIAALGTGLIILVLTLFKKVEVKISKNSPTITLVAPASEPILGKILKVSKEFDCTIHGLSTTPVEGSDEKVEVTFQAVFDSGDERLMEYISRLEEETKAHNIHLLSHR